MNRRLRGSSAARVSHWTPQRDEANVILLVHHFPGPRRLSMPALPQAPIRRGSPVPFYCQLAELLEQEIISGGCPAGARVPSETEMCRHFELSRATVRQALARLEQRGLINR